MFEPMAFAQRPRGPLKVPLLQPPRDPWQGQVTVLRWTRYALALDDGFWAGFPADHRALPGGYVPGSTPAVLPLIVAKTTVWRNGHSVAV